MIPAAALLAAAFVALALMLRTGTGGVEALDGLVQAGLGPLRTRPILVAFEWLTQAGTGGTGAIVAVVASGLLWTSGRAGLVAPLWLAFIAAEATCWPMKFIAGRPRPPALAGVSVASPSFPSAHATVSVAVYGFVALAIAASAPDRARPAILAAGAALILLIVFSRLLLSVHYFSDVLGGMLIGGAWLLLAWRWTQTGG